MGVGEGQGRQCIRACPCPSGQTATRLIEHFDKTSVAVAVVAERGTLYAHLHCAACKMDRVNVLYLERTGCCASHCPSPR
jgi:hypothetical protein